MIGVLTLVLASIPASVAIGAQGNHEGSYCFPPNDRAADLIERFAGYADKLDDARLTAAVTEEEFEPLREPEDQAVCKRLNEQLADVHSRTRTRDDGQERYEFDVSYFQLGNLYVIVMTPRPLLDKEAMQVSGEDEPVYITTRASYVQFRDENLEVLGNFGSRGSSLD